MTKNMIELLEKDENFKKWVIACGYLKVDNGNYQFIEIEQERGYSRSITDMIQSLLTEDDDSYLYPKHITDMELTSWREEKAEFEKWMEENGIDFEHVTQEGGREGEGEHVFAVFRINDKFYRADWSYASHYGYGDDYDDVASTLEEVKPRQVEITVYD